MFCLSNLNPEKLEVARLVPRYQQVLRLNEDEDSGC